MMDQREVFKRFMNERFLAFQNDKGERATVTQFADAISKKAESGEVIYRFYQGDVSHWLKGTRLPGSGMLKILAQSPLVGPGVWKAAGFELNQPELDPLEEALINNLRRMPPTVRQEFAKRIAKQAEDARRQHSQSEQPGLSFQAAP
jgi:hypothetical protein